MHRLLAVFLSRWFVFLTFVSFDASSGALQIDHAPLRVGLATQSERVCRTKGELSCLERFLLELAMRAGDLRGDERPQAMLS